MSKHKRSASKSVRPAQPWIEAFRAGTHTAMNGQTLSYSDADIAQIAAQINAQIASGYEPPIVTGHPATDSPRLGSIVGARAEGSTLLLQADDLDPEFAEDCQKGRYKYVSIALYPDKKLRHLGVLGAAAPAVKGLAPIAFGEGMFAAIDQGQTPEAVLEYAAVSVEELEKLAGSWVSRLVWRLRDLGSLFRRQREAMIEKDGAEAADKAYPEYLIKDLESLELPGQLPQFGEAPPPSSPPAPPAPPAAAPEPGAPPAAPPPAAPAPPPAASPEDRLAAVEAENQRLREELSARTAQAATAAFAERLDALTQAGRLSPVLRPHIERLRQEALKAGGVLCFAADDPVAQALDGLLDSLPQVVSFGAPEITPPPPPKNPLVADAELRASKES